VYAQKEKKREKVQKKMLEGYLNFISESFHRLEHKENSAVFVYLLSTSFGFLDDFLLPPSINRIKNSIENFNPQAMPLISIFFRDILTLVLRWEFNCKKSLVYFKKIL
jgi:hypothetical protein